MCVWSSLYNSGPERALTSDSRGRDVPWTHRTCKQLFHSDRRGPALRAHSQPKAAVAVGGVL